MSRRAQKAAKPGGRKSAPNGGAAKSSLNDKAYDDILECVRSSEFLPGSMITEGQLALKLGLSKAPIRTALTRLVQDGWLEPVLRRGHRVKPLTIADARDLFVTRKLIEPFTARMAAGRISDACRVALEAACDPKHANWRGLGPQSAFFAANKSFHVTIAEASGSRRLASVVASLHDEAERVLRYASKQHGLVQPDLLDDWAHGHDEILELLLSGNGRAAEKMALAQLEESERIVINALREKADQLPI